MNIVLARYRGCVLSEVVCSLVFYCKIGFAQDFASLLIPILEIIFVFSSKEKEEMKLVLFVPSCKPFLGKDILMLTQYYKLHQYNSYCMAEKSTDQQETDRG